MGMTSEAQCEGTREIPSQRATVPFAAIWTIMSSVYLFQTVSWGKAVNTCFFEIFNPNHHFVFTSETLAFVKGSLILEGAGVDDFE